MIDPQSRRAAKELRELRQAQMRKRWQDPEYRARMTALFKARAVALWSDPVTAEKKRAKLISINKDPTVRAKRSASLKAGLKNPARMERFRAMQAKGIAAAQASDNVKACASAKAIRVNEARRKRRDVVPPGTQKQYRKLRNAGLDRKAALANCWRTYHGATT